MSYLSFSWSNIILKKIRFLVFQRTIWHSYQPAAVFDLSICPKVTIRQSSTPMVSIPWVFIVPVYRTTVKAWERIGIVKLHCWFPSSPLHWKQVVITISLLKSFTNVNNQRSTSDKLEDIKFFLFELSISMKQVWRMRMIDNEYYRNKSPTKRRLRMHGLVGNIMLLNVRKMSIFVKSQLSTYTIVCTHCLVTC